ncbi:stage II sporulation protein P [Clostridium fermenticellae]|uniref:Stage II sporulation protein P n=1 Tax=Clostridium fermenticellae TaxID=2068654 RepID=A0A386H624_9CLOT|nr:stage II sporulation protein P [Clostridium fermenticellae]
MLLLNYRRVNNNNSRLRIFVLMMSVLLVIILPCVARANTYSNSVNRNLSYVEILNYTMPIIKVTSFNEEDMAENKFSISSTILSMLGFKINDPISIIEREASFISLAKDMSNSSQFKLDDKDIAKKGSDDSSSKNKNAALYDPTLKKQLNTQKPEVLIYHTHTTESYKPGNANNFDNSQNVCAVGDELISQLETNYGISGINDRTVHDAEAYTKSYERSAVTVDKYLKQYGDFKLIIDLHRDSVEDKNSMTMKINGENVAKFMIVMARKNPHFDKNMELANKIIQNSNKSFPGFCKGICYYNYGTRYFNQDKSNNAILIEIGADINTTTEAKASAKYLAKIIAECLNR